MRRLAVALGFVVVVASTESLAQTLQYEALQCGPQERVSSIRVAIEIDSGSAGRQPPNACYRIDSLCKAQGWEDSIVTGSDIDGAAELAEYDVVVTGDVGYNDNDFRVYEAALKDWVRNGGGFVGLGWAVYGVANDTAWQMDSVMAVSCTLHYGYLTTGRVHIVDSLHPVTRGVGDFDIQSHGEFAKAGLQPGATMLGEYTDSTGKASIAVREVGAGRSVYLGPIYFAHFGGYQNEPYYDDTNAMLLLKQAVEWAAGDSTGICGPRSDPVPRMELHQAVPTPSRSVTTISYSLSTAGPGKLVVCDIAGNQVRTLISGTMPAGDGKLKWNLTDDTGRTVPSGIYFCRLRSQGTDLSRKLVVR